MRTTDRNFEPELKIETIHDLIISELFTIFQKRDFAPIIPENLDDFVDKIDVLKYPIVKEAMEQQNLNSSIILSSLLDKMKKEDIITFGKKHKEGIYNDPQIKDSLSGCEILWNRQLAKKSDSTDIIKPISTEYGWGSDY